MPSFGSDGVSDKVRNVKAFFNPKGEAASDTGRRKDRAEEPKSARRRRISEKRKLIKSTRLELRKITNESLATKNEAERDEHIKRIKKKKLELFRLKNELRATKGQVDGVPDAQTAPQAEDEKPQMMGALPDFVIIGAAKSGTTYLYHLLTQHPLIQHAAFKEPHYFNLLFEDEGIEWYRQCFPQPVLKDGLRTITGEASPGYLFHALAPQRMAEMVPQARLIALLRNPVDRTYSAYHWRVKNGQETRTFEEAIEAGLAAPYDKHLYKSIYVDHLQRWAEFFDKEQMLVLKSEDFFENPKETLEVVIEFLGLPAWEPGASALGDKRNKGSYEQEMDPATRRRLEEYFEPHNQRLYEYLGVNFGW